MHCSGLAPSPTCWRLKHSRCLATPKSRLYVSLVSLCECAVKSSIGKLRLPTGFYRSVVEEYENLAVELDHIEAYEDLPLLHRDPFDRLLVAQARHADLTIVTRDANIAKYDVPIQAA